MSQILPWCTTVVAAWSQALISNEEGASSREEKGTVGFTQASVSIIGPQ